MEKRAGLYFDEDMSGVIAAKLRKAGWDVLTTHQAGRRGAGDADQLRFASELGRVLVTGNHRHFIPIHCESVKKGIWHAGIIVCFWRPSVGILITKLTETLRSVDPAAWPNSLHYA